MKQKIFTIQMCACLDLGGFYLCILATIGLSLLEMRAAKFTKFVDVNSSRIEPTSSDYSFKLLHAIW
jgi:hypothetical protein